MKAKGKVQKAKVRTCRARRTAAFPLLPVFNFCLLKFAFCLMNDPAAVIAALENAPSLVVPLVREVPREVLKRRPAPGRWSAHEHACHLADVHALFFSRLEQFLSEEHPRIEPFDPAAERPDGELLSVD